MSRCILAIIGIFLTITAHANPRRPDSRPAYAEEAASSDLLMPAQSATFADTIYFGGTMWAADSSRWEAQKDSVWTFESGVGSWINTGQIPGKPSGYHGAMEGWTGFNALIGDGVFRRSTRCAISGSYSLWAGLDSAEAHDRCYVNGQGYGNDWWVSRSKTFFYPGSGNVVLSFDYAVNVESNDGLYVEISGAGIDEGGIASLDGTGSGHEVVTLSIVEGSLPSTPGSVTISFFAYSDRSKSDKDGRFDSTCGHSVIDNIQLSGAINDLSDFETGENSWIESPVPPAGTGDLSHLAAINALPPMQVPGPCSVSDSVLVFHGSDFRIPDADNWAVSPWIDLKRAGCVGRPGKVLTFDMYSEYFWWPNGDFQYIRAGIRYRPSSRCATFRTFIREFNLGKWCSGSQPVKMDLSNLVDAGAEQVQVSIGVYNYRGAFSQTTDTPWIDNIRLGVYGTPTSDVPGSSGPPVAALLTAEPNPVRTGTTIRFTLPSDSRVVLQIVDIAGRLVRTLVDSPKEAGLNTVSWDGRDDSGQRIAAGIYFCRLNTGMRTTARKLVVLSQ